MPLHPIGPESSAGHQPGTPTIGSASAGNASASISFTAPDYLGKPIATTYTATSTPGSITGTSSTSPISVSGLTNGTSYTFKVKLSNSIVDSLESAASNSVTPTIPPVTPPVTPPVNPSSYLATACCFDGVVYYTTNASSGVDCTTAQNLASANCTNVGDSVVGVTCQFGTSYPSISCSAPAPVTPPVSPAPVTPPVSPAPVTPPVSPAPVTPPVSPAPVTPPVTPCGACGDGGTFCDSGVCYVYDGCGNVCLTY